MGRTFEREVYSVDGLTVDVTLRFVGARHVSVAVAVRWHGVAIAERDSMALTSDATNVDDVFASGALAALITDPLCGAMNAPADARSAVADAIEWNAARIADAARNGR